MTRTKKELKELYTTLYVERLKANRSHLDNLVNHLRNGDETSGLQCIEQLKEDVSKAMEAHPVSPEERVIFAEEITNWLDEVFVLTLTELLSGE